MADILNKIKQQKKDKGGKRSASKKSQDKNNMEEDPEGGTDNDGENGDNKFILKLQI